MKNFFSRFIFFLFIVFPEISEARTLRGIAQNIAEFLVGPLVALFVVLSLVLFIWGVIDFIRNAANSQERQKGKKKMVWGILALFVMFTFISITGIFTRSFFASDPILPQFYEKVEE